MVRENAIRLLWSRRGPYRCWWHEHHFEAAGRQTVAEDRVLGQNSSEVGRRLIRPWQEGQA